MQYPIYLPPLIESQIIDHLNEVLNPVIAASHHRFEAADGRLSFARAWVDLLDTPRAINRYAAQLRLILPLHRPGEVDLVDVALLTLIRLHAPQVFESISRSKSMLTSSHSSKEPFDWTLVIGDRVPVQSARAVQELVERLFPVTADRSGAVVPPRVGNVDYFDRYFMQGIPDDDVADSSVRFAVDECNQGDSSYLDLLLRTAKTDAKRGAILGKLERFSTWGEDAGTTPVAALKSVLTHLSSVSDRSAAFLPSAQMRAQRWAAEMLVCLPPEVSVSEVMDAIAGFDDKVQRTILFENVVYSSKDARPAAVLSVVQDAALSLIDMALENVRRGDAAEQFGLIERWTLLVREFALEEAQKRLASSLADGLSAEDLAARFVSIVHWSGGRGQTSIEMNGFLWDAYHQLLPEGLLTSEPDAAAEPDKRDVSWASRRQYALRELARRRELDSAY